MEHDVRVEMRDGAQLAADVYRPRGGGRFPVLVMRVPYDKTIAQTIVYAHPVWYARHGYVVVVQDVRGRYRSEGEFVPFASEAQDGYDTVEWAAGLECSTGAVGMYGFSYAGALQLQAAALRPPHLVAIAPAFTGSDFFDGWTYVGGALSLAFLESWVLGDLGQETALRQGRADAEATLAQATAKVWDWHWWLPLGELPPLRDTGVAPYFFDWLAHSTYDDFWRGLSIRERYDEIDVPGLHLAGWYDTFLEGTLQNFAGLARDDRESRRPQRLVVGPWFHIPWARLTGDVDFGDEADNSADELQIQWFDRWLKGSEGDGHDGRPVHLFTMGANSWRGEERWPPPAEEIRLYLSSGGRANSLSGDGSLSRTAPGADVPPDTFVYNPRVPVPSLGGRSCCVDVLAPMGACDQRRVEIRNDVLVYSSPVLDADLEVTGQVRASVWASSSAVDTDFTAKLVDVHPDGRAINLVDTIIRASYRESLERRSPIRPGEVYRYDLDVGSTSNLFRAGHRIRLEVSSSNFPLYDRNSNSGLPFHQVRSADLQPAVQTVFHDESRPSHVTLPVILR